MSKRRIPESGEVVIPADLREMAAEIEELSKPEAAEVPKGWFTARQFAKAWGFSDSYTRRKIQTYMENGIMERKDFRIQDGGRNYLYPVPHYRKAT